MTLRVVDTSTRANTGAAMDQESQRDAKVAPFADDDVTVRFYAGATLAETCTFGPVVKDSDDPRGWTLGALQASTVHVPDATITHAIYRTAGGTDILQADAADLGLTSPTTKTGRRTNLADAVRPKVTHTAMASLPVSGTPAPSGTFPTVPTTGLATFTLTPTSTGAHGWAVGHAFSQGDLPSGSGLDGVQCTVKSTWPDGSAKVALLAGGCAMTADTARTVGLTIGTAPSGTALSTAQLAAVLTDAVVFDAGAFGTASFSGADWSSPFQTWVSGPLMSSWVYRKQIGSDAHLVAWMEVRLWTDGSVEVLPWIENGYLNVAGPINKSATFQFTLGGSARLGAGLAIDLPHHCRTPLISGTALSYWLGTDPGVVVRHDVAYMQATELVPTYRATVASPSLQTSYTPLQQGGFTYPGTPPADNMAGGADQAPIGLLPQHDVFYLASTDAGAFASVVRNGFSAGRYAIHYRDEATNRPLRMSSYPTLVIASGSGVTGAGASTTGTYTPTPSGTSPPPWDGSHHPSVGYMAYLLTGRFYFMEEVQFAATLNYINITDSYRGGANGVTDEYRTQTRNAAWSARTLAHALTVTPDDDTALRAEFLNSMQATIDHFHARYIAQTSNPFGLLINEDYSEAGMFASAPWQNDFASAVFGWIKALDLPIDGTRSTRLDAFYAWLAGNIVGRLGKPVGEYWWINAFPYKMAYSPNTSISKWLNGTGVSGTDWYTDWAALYAATATIGSVAPYWSTTEGSMAAEIIPGQMSMIGNAMPALAYALRHGVTGAREAYNRVMSAANLPALETAFNTSPVWSIKPPEAYEFPAWRVGMAVNEWKAITGSAFTTAIASSDAASGFDAFSGAAFRYDTNELFSAAAGGHQDSGQNGVFSLRLDVDSPAWVERTASTPKNYGASLGWQPESIVSDAPPLDTLGRSAGAHYSDGLPRSRHVYYSNEWSSTRHRLITHRARFAWSLMGRSFEENDAWNPDTDTWDAANTLTSTGTTNTNVRDSKDVAWKIGGLSGEIKKHVAATDTWTLVTTFGGANMPLGPAAYDSLRDEFFIFNFGDGQGFGTVPTEWYAYRVHTGGTARQAITLTGAAFATWQAAITNPNGYMAYSSMDYDPINDRFLWTTGAGADQTIYAITPKTQGVASDDQWAMTTLTTTGATVAAKGAGGVLNRFRYVPALRGFVTVPSSSATAYFLRTS